MTQAPPPSSTQAPVCYRHPKRETWVSCSRCGKPICPECMNPAAVGFQCPDCVAEGRRTQRQVRTQFGAGRSGLAGRVTITLIAINVLVLIIEVISAGGGGIAGGGPLGGVFSGDTPLTDWGGLIPGGIVHPRGGGTVLYEGVATGEYYRLFTSMFFHYGLLHLGVNMWALWVVGRPLEAALGPWRFLALYLLSGIGGGIAVLYFAAPNILAAGASGAIFGLFGAFFFVLRRLGGDVRQLIPMIVINLLISFVPGIAWQDHLGGLVTGGLVSLALVYAPQRNRTLIQAAGIAAVAVVLAVLLVVWAAQH